MLRRWQVVFLISAGVFLALALAASWGGVFQPERGLYEAIAAGLSPAVVAVFWWINHLGSKWVLLPATGVLVFTLPRILRRRWWLWIAVMLVAPALEGLAKELVGRPRPEGLGMGFPSGHVTAAMAFFVMAAYLGEKSLASRRARSALWVVAALAIILVAIARVVLRAHWPLDTVGGAALGVACVAAAAWWNERHP
ncbi:MAG: phosphatase PAP2 family protein [Candidatus Rokubacteria bacterium]|nr:phosphatase PAP2 family protein [Candidatus Rokubacteria bacterium]